MKRNFGLDAIRAISIWLVMLQHGGYNIPGLEPLKIGSLGVEIFFVLSGFLIGGILFREIDKGLTLRKTLQRFWVRRWYRILPLYYLALLVKFTFFSNGVGLNILYYMFFLQNNFYGIEFYGVTWSLVIEEWFYLFAPIFLFLSNRILKSTKGVLFSIIGFIVLVNFLRFGYVVFTDVGFNGVNGNFPFRFDCLFIGVLLAYLRHNKFSIYPKLQEFKVFLLGAVVLIGYLSIYWTWANPVNQIDELLFPRTLGFFVLPASIGLMVPWLTTFKSIERKTVYGNVWYYWVTWTSVYTYAIYLIHTLVFKWTLSDSFIVQNNFVQMIIGAVFTYAIAALVYRFFEKPILDFRDRNIKR